MVKDRVTHFIILDLRHHIHNVSTFGDLDTTIYICEMPRTVVHGLGAELDLEIIQ